MRTAHLETDATEAPAAAALALAVPAVLVLLAMAGLGVSSYLAYTHWADASVACGGLGNCSTVNESEYAEMAGIPVALLGVFFYSALAVVALAWLWWRPFGLDWPVLAFWGMSVGGTLFSAYLTYIELFVLEAICVYCVASAAIALAALLISTAWVVKEAQAEEA